MDEETEKRLGKVELDNTYVAEPMDPADSTKVVANQSLFHRLFKRDKKKKEKEAEMPKKPEGPKLKTFEIVSFRMRCIVVTTRLSYSTNSRTNGISFSWFWARSLVGFMRSGTWFS